MDILEETPEGKELKSVNRTKARTICILTFTIVNSNSLLTDLTPKIETEANIIISSFKTIWPLLAHSANLCCL